MPVLGLGFGVRGRSIALCALLLLLNAVALGVVLLWQNHRAAHQAFVHHVVTNALAVSQLAEPFLLLADDDGLARMLSTHAADDTTLDAAVRDGRWRLRAAYRRSPDAVTEFEPHPHADADGAVGEVDVALRRAAGAAGPSTARTSPKAVSGARLYWGDEQILIVVPVRKSQNEVDLGVIDDDAPHAAARDRPLGFVLLTHTLAHLRAELNARLRDGALVTAAVLCVSVLLTFAAVNTLLRPLRDLVVVTQAIAAGNRSTRARENAVGEVGHLARSFNAMADRLQETLESIEHTVAQRTADLVRANRAKDDFLANMSHEIRTPMTAILGFTEHLAEPDLTPSDYLNAVHTIRRNGAHLLQIIDDILDLSKIEAGKLVIERIPFSIVQVVEDAVSLMRARAVSKGLEFQVEYLGALPQLAIGDPTRVRQILLNLLGNAIKFTHAGHVRLVTRLLVDDAGPGATERATPMDRTGFRPDAESAQRWTLQFDVSDTGVGMNAAQIDRLFQPFTQADESMTRRYGGTGLGLAICRRLARLMDGDVRIESQVGVGTTLSVTLSVGAIAGAAFIDPRQPLPQQTSDASVQPEADLTGVRLLLAEDGVDNQRLIAHMFRKAGAEVTTVDDGQAALHRALDAQAGGAAYDVILMDMQMPVMDGYTATTLLREKGYRGPVIALTAHAMSTDRARCLAAGCDAYATKPIDRRALLTLAAQHVGRAQPQPAETAAQP